MSRKINVTLWNEFIHEKKMEECKKIYPEGMHRTIAKNLGNKYNYHFASLEMDQHGLTDELLKSTDVMIWWGHKAHDQVDDKIVEKVWNRVMQGMGIIVLHSGHMSKIFRRLTGTQCNLTWREVGEKERLWVVEPYHPIAKGLNPYFELPHTEMYGEPFGIPQPDKVVFISWFEGGEVFRSGVTFTRGSGKIFYFRPGHETFPIFEDKNVIKVIDNAIEWAQFNGNKKAFMPGCPNVKEMIEEK